ncbi:MAG: adenylate/guanylate cyclase domain-containing protein, partial [Opitutae bacterium]|nr:adenylate/guanylate cyclase domain-containing protein [Opitutae bacterium]
MAFRFPQFRRFSLRLLAWLLGLLFAALGTTYLVVARFSEDHARARIERELEQGTRFVDENIRQRLEFLTANANLMTDDAAIRRALLAKPRDRKLIGTLLRGYTQRVGAPMITLFDEGTNFVADSDAKSDNENRGPFHFLVRNALRSGKPSDNGFAYLNHELFLLVVVPLYAPYPEIGGWFGLAFPLDQTFVEKIKAATRLDLTFVSTEELPKLKSLASTLPPPAAGAIVQAVADNLKTPERIGTVATLGEPYVTLFRTQEMLGDGPVVVVLQRALGPELAGVKELESQLLLVALAALAVAAVGALWVARGISKPVRQLAAHTARIATGDYSARLDLRRRDELGQLADAFNHMTTGLADRDRVRDLLGKVVSPEIASQLLGSELRLGGEEREVTILFADIRNFTALSESMSPTLMLALLNRYLDRMSSVIETHGGVIDKYIGDAIMALFGAPVAAHDAADRALAAAVAMGAALDRLNLELGSEGLPPLKIGIGVNTARVVAGNMGSKTRLNYTVIGDGVNLASRLEALTKEPGHRARIIVSEATVRSAAKFPPGRLRPLGEVSVKGKAQSVKI